MVCCDSFISDYLFAFGLDMPSGNVYY